MAIWRIFASLKYLTRWRIEIAQFIAMAMAMMVLCDSLLAVTLLFSPKNLMNGKAASLSTFVFDWRKRDLKCSNGKIWNSLNWLMGLKKNDRTGLLVKLEAMVMPEWEWDQKLKSGFWIYSRLVAGKRISSQVLKYMKMFLKKGFSGKKNR